MDFDHLAEEQSERLFQVWIRNLISNAPEELAAKLAAKHWPGTPTTASRFSNGAFNLCYRVTYQDGSRILVRFTALGRVLLRNEKVEDEVAVMNYLAQNTPIPVPKVIGSGKCAVGPYMVMTIIEGNLLSGYLKDPLQEVVTLNPKIPISALKRAYYGMAEIMLELSKSAFPFIGALREDEFGGWDVHKRPVTFNMNRLAQFSNIPPGIFAKQRFTNTADYFEELAKQHLYHLEFQRNDAVKDEADCRKKYIARCLFRKISREIPKEHRDGPFRLFCDDLRPGNILVDASNLTVSGAIDWEFTYAAPAEFTYTAPWWLLLERPEEWEPDLNQFLARYMPRFHIFLDTLRECERSKIIEGSLSDSQRLSGAMEVSMETGLFWDCLALRHSSMFDDIYWTFIDQRYYGPFTTIEDRITHLSEEEGMNLENFVQSKIQQAAEGRLISHQSVDEMVDM
ncbi:kinase-like domain-containing protein [Talaromyces proteolyticus]|uniref:Kinase-like domain-containing protein n=1 Tax=Talaromyces proteolyticus TaxID=1131652 RepID=A0AAD4L1Z2_9EURO|nr:kinase-like domain-containing protein [Talaromyces proteolyticus]KAH8706068.1 kinase-like domain-containing protein [Talaromyces proteolyticus]